MLYVLGAEAQYDEAVVNQETFDIWNQAFENNDMSLDEAVSSYRSMGGQMPSDVLMPYDSYFYETNPKFWIGVGAGACAVAGCLTPDPDEDESSGSSGSSSSQGTSNFTLLSTNANGTSAYHYSFGPSGGFQLDNPFVGVSPLPPVKQQ